MTSIRHFWSDDQGQNWSLALTFVALVFVVIFIAGGADLASLWNHTDIQLLAANTSAG